MLDTLITRSLSVRIGATLAASFVLAVPAVFSAQAPTPKPSAQVVDISKSSVSATFRQTGVSSESPFKKFSIAIDFDPANPAQTRAQVEIDMTSFDLGDPDYNAELAKKEWFNAAQYPKATFVSTSAKAVAAGKLEVPGKLTLKGKTVDLTIPVAYRQEGTNTVFEGTIPIKRLAFNIGEGEWKDTATLDDEVRIKFKVTLAARK